jgi:hypothetical protein
MKIPHKKKGYFRNPLIFFGGAEGDRTPGLMTASHALSQLSYSPKFEMVFNKT